MGAEAMTELQSKLVRLFEQAKAKLVEVLSPGEAEPEMAAFVGEVQRHPEAREFVVGLFMTELSRPGSAWEFLQFCFHVLRWPEMREFVLAGLEKDMKNLRARAVWSHVLESFDDDWSDAEFYHEFSRAD
jgi:hypothetical protein